MKKVTFKKDGRTRIVTDNVYVALVALKLIVEDQVEKEIEQVAEPVVVETVVPEKQKAKRGRKPRIIKD